MIVTYFVPGAVVLVGAGVFVFTVMFVVSMVFVGWLCLGRWQGSFLILHRHFFTLDSRLF